jgi:hypothetical protein
MVLGSIINWVVFRTLDLSVNTILWVTQKTVVGVYNVGHYLIIPKKNINNDSLKLKESIEYLEMLPLPEIYELKQKELSLVKEQNKLLRKEIELHQPKRKMIKSF